MHAVTFGVAAAVLVAFAVRRAPSWGRGALEALAGVLVLAIAAYAWMLFVFYNFALVAPLFHALGASGLRSLGILVYWLPPLAAGLATVLLLGRRRAPAPTS
jgi:uncharacterized YccA/Bax inhibitor family protein